MRQGIFGVSILVAALTAVLAEPPTYGSNSEEFDINSISSYLDDDTSTSSADPKGSSFNYGGSGNSATSYKGSSHYSSPYSSPSYDGISPSLSSFGGDSAPNYNFPQTGGAVSYSNTDVKSIGSQVSAPTYGGFPHAGSNYKTPVYTGPPVQVGTPYNPTLHTGPATFNPGPHLNAGQFSSGHVSPPFGAQPPVPPFNFAPQTHIPGNNYFNQGQSPFFSNPSSYSGQFGQPAYKNPYSDYKFGGSPYSSPPRAAFAASFNRPNTYESPYSSGKFSSSVPRYPRYPTKFASSASSSRPSYVTKSYSAPRHYASNYKSYSGSKPSSYSTYPGSL